MLPTNMEKDIANLLIIASKNLNCFLFLGGGGEGQNSWLFTSMTEDQSFRPPRKKNLC